MAYEKHEMSVMLFSKKDAVFADDDTTLISDDDNAWSGDKDKDYGNYDDLDD